MTSVIRLFSYVLLLVSISFANAADLSDYSLGAGDLLGITVYGEEDLSLEVRLSDAGTISYPFLGEISTNGLSTGELGEVIRSRLADGYLVNPSVNVTVIEYRQFFIYGAVEKPGAYPYQPGLTLQKAVALAGGFTERASSDKFFVLSEDQVNTDPVRIDINSAISPGDTVTVEESFF
ncbi:MAG: capsular biosynthesis protein [Neptuniibacter caesariensis]|uniref:Capsular biosynthesis protein n=1 Tax=Neptuniibacter caesariensis TaxID=207954 RepID=A0A2G6JPS5_NEPCE|nr:MAG: capsular biosynthesis protein [Neptuniibacter caesariensis]